jgi:Periplasmic binding protein
MQPTTPRKRRSPLVRYAPFIVIVVAIAIVAVALAVSNKDNKKTAITPGGKAAPASEVPIQYQAAQKAGTVAKYTWQDHCDPATGRVAMPLLAPAPCVPKYDGNNGGVIAAPAVTADTIRIGYYLGKPDPVSDGLLKATGAYDPPAKIEAAIKDYVQLFESQYQLWGRKIQLVKIQGTGASDDEVAAKADADKAAQQLHVYAVIGGPAQAQSFSSELAANKVLCIGTCSIAAPQRFIEEHSPYIWPLFPSPEQTSQMLVSFIKQQLVGKPAQYAGDPSFRTKTRTFAFLSYDTKDGRFKASWDDLVQRLKDAGVPLKLHKTYFLDFNALTQNAHDIAVALKQANATSVIFTGDPLMPSFFTKEATAQNYHPEWIMGGTVLADTSVFGRSYDQTQWAHAFGLQLTPTRVVQSKNQAYTVHQWYYGTKPPSDKSYAITLGDLKMLFDGLQTAGPKLTPDNFRAGMYGIAPPTNADATIATVTTFGDHGFWNGNDPNGLDNAGILWWNPNARGEDETGIVGNGMYELVDGGKRYPGGKWPSTPAKLFDPAGAVTIYNDLPPDLTPKSYPSPPGSPAAVGG